MDNNQNRPQPDVQEPAAPVTDINHGYAPNFDPRIETCPCMSCRSDMAYIHPCLLA